jgi:hypothetical protein
VAAARTNNHRGVITAVPKELSLGLTRWTLNAATFRHTRGDRCDRDALRERLRAKHDCLPAIRLFSYGHIVHARTAGKQPRKTLKWQSPGQMIRN